MVRAAWSWARDPFWSALKMFHALIISPVPAIASLSAPQIPRVFDKHAPAAGAGPREARASIILSYRVQQYQTLRTVRGIGQQSGRRSAAGSPRLPIARRAGDRTDPCGSAADWRLPRHAHR